MTYNKNYNTDCSNSSQPPKFQNREFSTFFINSNKYKKVAEIRGVRNPRYKAYCAKTQPLATYRKQFKKGGNGTNRTLENLEIIGCLVVDIDWNRPGSLDHQRLLDHCDRKGVPRPNKIISTPAPNHYQLFWNIPYLKRDKLGWHYRTAKALYKLFEEFDADASTTVDPVKITRNPDYLEADIVYHSDHINTLGFIYHALKKTGLIKNKSKSKYPRRRTQIPFSDSFNAIESFLKQQGTYKGTHESIYKELRIPKSTYFLLLNRLKKQEKISMTTLRVGKTWVTEFKYFDGLRKEFNNMGGGVVDLLRVVILLKIVTY